MGFGLLCMKLKMTSPQVVLNQASFKIKNQQFLFQVLCGLSTGCQVLGGFEETRGVAGLLAWSRGSAQASHWPSCVPSGRKGCHGCL